MNLYIFKIVSENYRQPLEHPPIIEAVVGFDCMMPPSYDLTSLQETAQEKLKTRYPSFRAQHVHETELIHTGDKTPVLRNKTGLNALQFVTEDKLQLLQFHKGGFSFNRLKPYTSLDAYEVEIQEGWEIFAELAHPESIRKLSMRNINRLMLPLKNGDVELAEFINTAPTTPENSGLSFKNFVHQHNAWEKSTGNEARIVLASEAPEGGVLPIILDITTSRLVTLAPDETEEIEVIIESLRDLKDRVFYNSITDSCRKLFQQNPI